MKREFEPINKNLTEVQSFQGSLFAVYKIKQGSFEFQHSKRSLLFLKVILVTLFFSLFLSFSANATGTSSESAETNGEGPFLVAQITEKCKTAEGKAKTETTGASPESTAMMMQMASQASSMGGNIKTGHTVNAGINTTLAISVGMRCKKCKVAVSDCRSECDADDKCQNFRTEAYTCTSAEGTEGTEGVEGEAVTFTSCSTSGPNSTLDTECQAQCNTGYTTCKNTLTGTFEKCEALATQCNQVCLQAGLSGMMALGSLEQLRKLCDGSDCDKSIPTSTGSPEELAMPDSVKVGSGSGIGGTGTTLGTGNNQVSGSVLPSQKLDTSKTKDKEEEKDQQAKKEAQKKGSSLDLAHAPNFGEDGGTYDQNSLVDDLDNTNSSGLKAGKKANKNKKSSDKFASNGSFQINQGFFAKGSDSQQASAGSSGSQSGSGAFSKKEKTDNSLEKKRSTASEKDSGVHSSDNIFKKASYVISEFCSNDKC